MAFLNLTGPLKKICSYKFCPPTLDWFSTTAHRNWLFKTTCGFLYTFLLYKKILCLEKKDFKYVEAIKFLSITVLNIQQPFCEYIALPKRFLSKCQLFGQSNLQTNC